MLPVSCLKMEQYGVGETICTVAMEKMYRGMSLDQIYTLQTTVVVDVQSVKLLMGRAHPPFVRLTVCVHLAPILRRVLHAQLDIGVLMA
jgi:hypothetical protein